MASSKPKPEKILRELLSDRPDSVVDAAMAARKAVLSSAEACSELIYETYCISDAFSFTGKLGQAFIQIATYAKHVNIGFDRGTELPDPQGLLKGTGKRIRHVRLNDASDLDNESILALIDSAVALGMSMAENAGGIVPAQVVVNRRSK